MENIAYKITVHTDSVGKKIVVQDKTQSTNFQNAQVQTPFKQDYTSWFGDVAPWGLNNLYPQEVFEISVKNPIVTSIIREKTNFLAMMGYQIGQVEFKEGEEIFTPKENTEIRSFLRYINFKDYVYRVAKNIYWLNHAFAEVVIGSNGKIINVSTHDSTHCRYSRQNEFGRINHCYINANWDKITSENSEYTFKRELIQRDYNPVQDLQNRAVAGERYIYSLYEPELTATYYPMAAWHTAINSKVLEWANQIPQYKAALMKNQLSADFLIEIAGTYWEKRYSDWHEKPELKETRVKDVKTEIQDNLTGAENASKTIFAPMEVNALEAKQYSFIKITKLGNTENDGRYIQDSQEACSLILFAHGMPVDLLGNLPSSSGMGGGSGSPTREHFNIYVQKIQPQQDLILETFNRLIFPFNGWDGWEIRFKIPVLQTLDKVPTDQRN